MLHALERQKICPLSKWEQSMVPNAPIRLLGLRQAALLRIDLRFAVAAEAPPISERLAPLSNAVGA
jgi:hypothetical protein